MLARARRTWPTGEETFPLGHDDRRIWENRQKLFKLKEDDELGISIQEKHVVGGSIVYLRNRKFSLKQEGKGQSNVKRN